MKEIKNKEELDAVLSTSGDNLVILKFSAPWCGPCQYLGNVIKNIEPELGDVTFLECNVDEADEEFVKSYGVRNIPALIYFMGGYQVDKTVGSKSRADLLSDIEKNKQK